MVFYDELYIGKVIRFDTRPGKMHGWVEITNGNTDEIGKSFWFHYNDGVFLNHNDGDIEWGETAVLDDDLIIDEPYHRGIKGLRRLSVPKVGDELIFDLGQNDHGLKAKPWTYHGYFQTVATVARPFFCRILDATGAVVCRWRHNPYVDTVLIDEGTLPDTLDDSMSMEYYVPADIVDGDGGEFSFPLPSQWVTPDRVDAGMMLVGANSALRKVLTY